MSRDVHTQIRNIREILARHNVYKAGEITVTDSDYTTITPDFDAELFDIYAVDGDILVKFVLPDGTDGDDIKIPVSGTRYDWLDFKAVKIKAVSGSVTVNYYLSGYKSS